MKWNNRLKSVLTEPVKSEFSGECLETPLTKTAKTPTNVVSSAFVSAYSRHSFKNNDELADFKTEKFHEVLNRSIENGITFDVSIDDFQIIDETQFLKASDRAFFEINKDVVLCHLQQSLLMKHLFSHSPERFEDFAFEIMERESLLTLTAKTPFEIYAFAVKDITKRCFADLLKKKT